MVYPTPTFGHLEEKIVNVMNIKCNIVRFYLH